MKRCEFLSKRFSEITVLGLGMWCNHPECKTNGMTLTPRANFDDIAIGEPFNLEAPIDHEHNYRQCPEGKKHCATEVVKFVDDEGTLRAQ